MIFLSSTKFKTFLLSSKDQYNKICLITKNIKLYKRNNRIRESSTDYPLILIKTTLII